MLLAILGMTGVIRSVSGIGEGTVAAGYQNFLICIEMFFASIAMHFAFPHRRYGASTPESHCGSPGVTIGSLQSISSNLKEAVNPRDIVADAVYNFHPQYQQYTRHDAAPSSDELDAYYHRRSAEAGSQSPDSAAGPSYQDQALVVPVPPSAAAGCVAASGKSSNREATPASSATGDTVGTVMPGLTPPRTTLNEKAVLLPTGNDVV